MCFPFPTINRGLFCWFIHELDDGPGEGCKGEHWTRDVGRILTRLYLIVKLQKITFTFFVFAFSNQTEMSEAKGGFIIVQITVDCYLRTFFVGPSLFVPLPRLLFPFIGVHVKLGFSKTTFALGVVGPPCGSETGTGKLHRQSTNELRSLSGSCNLWTCATTTTSSCSNASFLLQKKGKKKNQKKEKESGNAEGGGKCVHKLDQL